MIRETTNSVNVNGERDAEEVPPPGEGQGKNRPLCPRPNACPLNILQPLRGVLF